MGALVVLLPTTQGNGEDFSFTFFFFELIVNYDGCTYTVTSYLRLRLFDKIYK